jgi:hypothetical protein
LEETCLEGQVARGPTGTVCEILESGPTDLLEKQEMPRYVTQHSLACLTRQGAEVLARRMHEGGGARAERIYLNMTEGKMLAEFQSESREGLESWLSKEKIHFDWILRVEWELIEGRLQSVA